MSAAHERAQRDFAAYVRDPLGQPSPAGIEPRRMTIHAELVYNAFDGFLAGGFPVLKSLLDAARWQALVRDFVATHACRTPYFLQIGEEFLAFLQAGGAQRHALPGFALELAHYEWVELALDVSEQEVDAPGIERAGALESGIPVLSALAWPLSYAWPVHRICEQFQPEAPQAQPSCLVVYRNRADDVKFLESNPATLRLLALVREERLTGRELAAQLAAELGQPGAAAIESAALDTLERLRELDIVAGVRTSARNG
jgi:hypothetical protein